MATVKCLVTNILQKSFFVFNRIEHISYSLEQLDGE